MGGLGWWNGALALSSLMLGVMSQLKSGQKSIRIVLPEAVYNRLKLECPDHGDLSKLVRRLVIKYLISIADDLPDMPEEDLP